MKIYIKTEVGESVRTVWDGFNESLFLKLAPPFIPFRLLRFDGCKVGDEVHIELSFGIKKQIWISEITDNQISQNEIYFIDEGKQLPFFLKYWKHKHVICCQNNKTYIIDDIEFLSHNQLFSILLYPFLYLQFLYRKPIYKQIFTKNQAMNGYI